MQGGWRAALLALLVFFFCDALAQDATLDQARRLIESKQPNEAFALLSPLEQQRAGDPQFDYLLGVAALDSGRHTRAVFALERVLALRPDHAQARAEIARAYFLMGEDKAARQEFEAVKGARPPAEAAATIERFLNALDARERLRGTGFSAYLEASLGHDSNTNAATSAGQFAVPLLSQLLPGALFSVANERSDDFFGLGGGVNGRYALGEDLGLIGGASFDQRLNARHDEFDTGSLNASGGVSLRRDSDEYIAAAQLQRYSVDQDRFRDAAGVVAQWRRTLSASNQISAYGQLTRLRYPGQTERDADRSVAGGAWAHAYSGASASFAGAYVGKEDPRAGNVEHFGHDLWGLRLGGQLGASERWIISANIAYEERKYGGRDPLFLVERRDRELQLRLAASYLISPSWSVTPAVGFTGNHSNIVIHDYQRTIASLTLRHDFR